MQKKYRRHSGSFKSKVAMEALKGQKALEQLSSEYCVAPTQISTWKKYLENSANSLFEGKKEKSQQGEIDKLHRIIGQITAERDFLERALNRWT